MSLAQNQDARRTRLEALKKLKADQALEGNGSIIKNRNYDPESRTIRKSNQREVAADTVEKDIEGVAEKIITEDQEKRAQDLDIFNIAPKRANWDLKREVAKKTAKLERKTQEAIHILIRQRLAAQNGQSDDLVGAMRAQEKADVDEPSSEEE